MISYKDAIDKLRALDSAPNKPGPVEFAHFGNLRGKDVYKDSDMCVLVGRPQPAVHDLENMAAALWWDSDKRLELTGELIERPAGYRMRDGSKQGTWVSTHPDPLVQSLMELTREAEIAQAMDRLRLIHGGDGKRVLILCSLPADTPVDELFSYNDVLKRAKIRSMIDRYPKGVVPLTPSWVVERHPDLYADLNAAKQALKRFKDQFMHAGYSNRKKLYRFVSYRVQGERGGHKTALADLKLKNSMVTRELQRLHKKPVKLVDPG